MSIIASIIDFTQTPAFTGIVTGLLIISEALASIPSIKANSIFQLVLGALEKLAKKPA